MKKAFDNVIETALLRSTPIAEKAIEYISQHIETITDRDKEALASVILSEVLYGQRKTQIVLHANSVPVLFFIDMDNPEDIRHEFPIEFESDYF